MKLITYRYGEKEAIGVFVDDRVIPMTELGVQEKTMLSFIPVSYTHLDVYKRQVY